MTAKNGRVRSVGGKACCTRGRGSSEVQETLMHALESMENSGNLTAEDIPRQDLPLRVVELHIQPIYELCNGRPGLPNYPHVKSLWEKTCYPVGNGIIHLRISSSTSVPRCVSVQKGWFHVSLTAAAVDPVPLCLENEPSGRGFRLSLQCDACCRQARVRFLHANALKTHEQISLASNPKHFLWVFDRDSSSSSSGGDFSARIGVANGQMKPILFWRTHRDGFIDLVDRSDLATVFSVHASQGTRFTSSETVLTPALPST